MVTDKQKEAAGELEAVREELAGLRQEMEAQARQLEEREAALARLEQALAGKDSELAALKQALADDEKSLTETEEALAQAVASYKEMVIEANPGVLAELITGATIDEVNESLQNARALMDRVRQEMEAEASRTRVPAGAPQRAPLDLSGLSPREKIQYAIGGNR